MDDIRERPSVEFAFLADKAGSDKTGLYVSGGARNTLFRNAFDDQLLRLVMVVGTLIPWSMAGQRITLRYRLENEDGQIIGDEYSWEIWVNLIGDEEEGMPLRALTVETPEWPLPREGTYVAFISADESPEYWVRFHVRSPRNDFERAATR